MSVASDLIAALDAETTSTAGARTTLLSVTIDVVGHGAPVDTHVRIVRATRSLVFSEAEARDDAGARVITASAVHKIAR
ncbi:MAG: hypothetical protein GC206_05960 [Alphaproteobacteria bacterium]|nr:hypothetical protein [Alphaproteobacteria bacterium]